MMQLNKTLHLAVLVVFLLPFFLAGAEADASARISGAKGQVLVKVPDSEWFPARDGQQVTEKMSIKTGKNGRANISMSDDSSIALLSSTEIFIAKDLEKMPSNQNDENVTLHSGTIIIRTSGRSEKSELRISTNTASMAVQKGVFSIRTDGDKSTTLGVAGGKACAEAKSKRTCAEDRQAVVIKKNSAPGPALAPDMDTAYIWKSENMIPEPQNAGSTLSLSVYQPQDGSSATKSTVSITGKTVPGATLLINGEKAEVHSTGDFSTKLKLSEGDNRIVVEARLGDKKKSVALKVKLDTSPPLLNVSQPINGFDPSLFGVCDSRRCRVQVFGLTEPGVSLRINRTDVSRYVESDGSFLIQDFSVDRTETALIIEAEDTAHQISRQIITIAQPGDMGGFDDPGSH